LQYKFVWLKNNHKKSALGEIDEDILEEHGARSMIIMMIK
jgi:hypothetical protein